MGDTNGKRKGDQRSPQHEIDPARKVMRNGSDLDSSFDFCERLTSMMDQYKGKMTATLTLMDMENNPGMTEVKDWMTALAKHQITGMDNMACLVTEMYTEMENMEKELHGKTMIIKELQQEIEAQDKVVKSVVVTKEKIEVKASSKEMEDRLKVAVTQFKVMDMDIGKETENRTEIIGRGLAAIKSKVRSDYQDEWVKLAEGVEVTPLVRKTSKPTGKDFFTAPLLFTVQDKTKRWRMEEILRNSRIYPGFHWPQEMMPVIKGYKTVLKDGGVNEESTYVRIRPVERDGKVKLRADVKDKEGSAKFVVKATWEAPPLCPEIRKMARDHLKPLWASNRG